MVDTVEGYWKDGIARGNVLARFLEREVGQLDPCRILDVGCAMGGISLALANHGAQVVGIDISLAEVQQARLRREPNLRGPAFLSAEGLHLPFADCAFDVVLSIGVLEYMGRGHPEVAPCLAQLLSLREMARVLTDGGSLVLAIENRWYPPFLLRSPHQGAVGSLLLPHAVAHRLGGFLRSGPLWDRLHGFRGLERLLQEAGFGHVTQYCPVYGYQFPKAIPHADDGRELWRVSSRDMTGEPTGYEELTDGGRWGPLWFRLIAALGLQKMFAPALLMIAKK